jgi:hypothetical protein
MQAVYISSTLGELVEYRRAVIKAIHELELDVLNTENIGSHINPLIGKSMQQINKADIFVGIISPYRYGQIPEGVDEGFPEREYNEAVRQGIPRLVYWIENPNANIIELEEDRQRKLKAFRYRLQKREKPRTYQSPQSLANAVQRDIKRKRILRRIRKGLRWVTIRLLLIALPLLLFTCSCLAVLWFVQWLIR